VSEKQGDKSAVTSGENKELSKKVSGSLFKDHTWEEFINKDIDYFLNRFNKPINFENQSDKLDDNISKNFGKNDLSELKDLIEKYPNGKISVKIEDGGRKFKTTIPSSLKSEISSKFQPDKREIMSSGDRAEIDRIKTLYEKYPYGKLQSLIKDYKERGGEGDDLRVKALEELSEEKPGGKSEITSQGDKINAAADKLDAAVKGEKAPESSGQYMVQKEKEINDKIKKIREEIKSIPDKVVSDEKTREAFAKRRRLEKEIEDLTQKYNGPSGALKMKEEYRKIASGKSKLSGQDMREFPDLAADQLKKDSGIDFGHDEELAPNDIRARYNGEQIKVDSISDDGKIKVRIAGNTLREWMTPAEVKTYLDNKKKDEDSESNQKQESIKSQGWQPSSANKEGFKLRLGKGYQDISPKDIKKTFKVWGEDVFVIKSPNGGYSATEKKTGLKIGDGTNVEKAIDKAKLLLSMQGEKRFKEAVSSQEIKDKPLAKASELQRGTEEESEHKATVKFIAEYLKKHNKLPSNEEIYKSIAKDHIGNIPDYYSRLSKMEKEAKLSKATDTLFEALEKAKKMPIGTVNKKGYKKVAEGKWVKEKGKGEGKPDEKKKPGKDEKKPAEKGGLDEEKRGILKSALKKVANILAEALSGRGPVGPAGEAVEQAGENVKIMGKKKPAIADKKKEGQK